MSIIFQDTFTDTDLTLLTSHSPDTGTGWSEHALYPGSTSTRIFNNRAFGGVSAQFSPTTPSWMYADAPASADYEVSIFHKRSGLSSADTDGNFVLARMDTAVKTAYFAQKNNGGATSTGDLVLGKYVSGTKTTFSTVNNAGDGDGTLILSVQGTTITGYWQRDSDGQWLNSSGSYQAGKTHFAQTTDSSITSAGRPGFDATNSSSSARSHVDDFTVETVSNTFNESLTSNLSLTQKLNEKSREVESDILLGQNLLGTLLLDDRQVPESVLSLSGVAEVSGLLNAVSSTLNLSGVATVGLLDQPEINQNLGLNQSATGVIGVPWGSPWGVANVEQDIVFSQSVVKDVPASATSSLSLTQTVQGSLGLSSTLNLTQSVSGGLGYDAESLLSFTQTVDPGESIWNRSISQSISMTSAANGWNANDPCLRRFGRQTTPLASNGKLTLYSVDGLHSLVLKNPETDNRRRASFDRVLRETRGGDLIVYRDPNWNTVQSLQFTIIGIKRSLLTDLQTFMDNTLGEEIVLVDWLGEEWRGIITRPDEIATEDNEGYWTYAFEFEGSKKSGNGTYQNINLTSTATATVV